MKKIYIIAPDSLVESILTYALRVDDNKFNIKDVFAYATSVNTRQIINGKDVLTPIKLPPVDLYFLTHVLYIYVFAQKWRAGKIDQKLLDREKRQRNWSKRWLLAKIFLPYFNTDRSIIGKNIF